MYYKNYQYLEIKKLLDQDGIPNYSDDCNYCTYVQDVDSVV